MPEHRDRDRRVDRHSKRSRRYSRSRSRSRDRDDRRDRRYDSRHEKDDRDRDREKKKKKKKRDREPKENDELMSAAAAAAAAVSAKFKGDSDTQHQDADTEPGDSSSSAKQNALGDADSSADQLQVGKVDVEIPKGDEKEVSLNLDDFEEEIRKRRERVQAWQNAKRRKAGAGAVDLAAEGSSEKPKVWSLEDESGSSDGDVEEGGNEGDGEMDDSDDDDDNDEDDGGDKAEEKKSPEKATVEGEAVPSSSTNGTESSMEGITVQKESGDDDADDDDDDDRDVDPLEAFMTSLDDVGDVVPQESINDLPEGAGAGEKKTSDPLTSRRWNPFVSNTITLEEIMGGIANEPGASKGSFAKAGDEDWESDMPQSDVDDTGGGDESEDEDALDQDKAQFMEAMRAMHGTSEDKPATEGGQKAAAEDSAGEKKPDEESGATAAGKKKETAQSLGRMWASEGDVMEEHERNNEEENALEMLQEAMRKKELAPVDHTLVDYIPIRKNMYILPKALAHLLKPENAKELNAKREDLEIKIRGRGCPPPVDTWAHCGISDRVLAQLTRVYGPDSAPFAVQKQAIPAIMSGRDIIGIAKTGSGKTLAFLLPMFRHILDQPVLGEGEGPIGIILAPARELAVQIYNEAKKFTKSLGLRVTAIYGGAGVAEQIGEMKRGSDIVVCTPGRMIDILTMQAGKLVSLRRVSFVVMDEADRMFDMGFEPQIRMILQNVRPDRQTCLFSATFPDKVQNLAKKSLKAPVEIVVGGRSVANAAITQHAEVRDEDDKFMRLLQLLGVWFERGHVLVFVDTQQRCDRIFEDLMRSGYPCLSLHGGKDQHDRDQTIADFKNKVCTLMVATSVAGRGLDVPDLVCVVNYSCPNHIEDYVHRVGRTGRAGKKGTAYTFISKDEEQYAPLLVKALTQAKQEIPTPLQEMADAFRKKIDAGDARWASSGFGGSGFTFDNSEKNEVQRLADMQRRQYEIENGLRDPANLFSDEEGDIDSDDEREAKAATEAASAAASSAVGQGSTAIVMPGAPGDTPLERAKRLATQLAAGGGSMVVPHNPMASGSTAVANALAQAKLFAQRLSQNQGATTGTSMNLETGTSAIIGQETAHHEDDLVINDYPQKARWKITHRETIDDVSEKFSVAIISRGGYIPPGKKPKEGERKLYLAIEGHSELAVSGARRELVRILNEETMRVGLDPRASYSVV